MFGNYRRPKRDRELNQKGAQRRTPIVADGSCCSVKLDALVPTLHSAERTKREVASLAKQAGPSGRSGKCKYNYSRLRGALEAAHVWDLFGNCNVHHSCLGNRLGVTVHFLASIRSSLIETAKTPLTVMSKWQALSLGLEEDLLVPVEFQHMSVKSYLKGIDGSAMVQVPTRKISHHGLSGKPSNHSAVEQRRLFSQFIECNRSPTGRTPDESGRFHGAE